MNLRRMLISLFRLPIIFLIGAIVALVFLGFVVPNMLSDIDTFSRISDSSRNITPDIVLFLLGLSFLSAVYSSFQLWKWERGKTEFCYSCGGMVEFRPIGKYGPHYRCLACGENRNAE